MFRSQTFRALLLGSHWVQTPWTMTAIGVLVFGGTSPRRSQEAQRRATVQRDGAFGNPKFMKKKSRKLKSGTQHCSGCHHVDMGSRFRVMGVGLGMSATETLESRDAFCHPAPECYLGGKPTEGQARGMSGSVHWYLRPRGAKENSFSTDVCQRLERRGKLKWSECDIDAPCFLLDRPMSWKFACFRLSSVLILAITDHARLMAGNCDCRRRDESLCLSGRPELLLLGQEAAGTCGRKSWSRV